MVYSQAVLEHAVDLSNTYKAMRLWLKTDGFLSHQIDFKSHETADEWNGHLAYSSFLWKLIMGRRLYLLNREPHSTHVDLLRNEKSDIVDEDVIRSEKSLKRDMLAMTLRHFSDDDITISNSFVQALKQA